ncbi:MAG: hypothetical protein J0L53_11060 [Spirochaetes bacterium]|nr:hypothetical protein [Spirochaetota bacterium]
MKKDKAQSLVEKASARLEKLRSDSADLGAAISVEAQQGLEKALEAYRDATAHVEGAKREYDLVRSHRKVAGLELRAAYKAVKKQAGLAKDGKKGKKKKKGGDNYGL